MPELITSNVQILFGALYLPGRSTWSYIFCFLKSSNIMEVLHLPPLQRSHFSQKTGRLWATQALPHYLISYIPNQCSVGGIAKYGAICQHNAEAIRSLGGTICLPSLGTQLAKLSQFCLTPMEWAAVKPHPSACIGRGRNSSPVAPFLRSIQRDPHVLPYGQDGALGGGLGR